MSDDSLFRALELIPRSTDDELCKAAFSLPPLPLPVAAAAAVACANATRAVCEREAPNAG